ncbi:MAG: hypothetical protein AAGB02_08825 [Pseudomonadota bacterium]
MAFRKTLLFCFAVSFCILAAGCTSTSTRAFVAEADLPGEGAAKQPIARGYLRRSGWHVGCFTPSKTDLAGKVRTLLCAGDNDCSYPRRVQSKSGGPDTGRAIEGTQLAPSR